MRSEEIILICDDSQTARTSLKGMLDEPGRTLVEAGNGTECLEKADELHPSLIILDLGLPDMDGFAVLHELRDRDGTRRIPVVFVSADQDPKQVAIALDLGASDYVTKPVTDVELQARVRSALRTKYLVELLEANSRVDALTGIGNREEFDRAIATCKAARRRGTPYSVVLIDVDEFKRINDTRGHGIGDQILTRIAAVLNECSRASDRACRIGGDEFAIVLPGVDEEARRIAGRIETGIAQAANDAPEHFTCSIGLATGREATGNLDIVTQADEALYAAKRAGKNRLIVAPTTAGGD